MQSSTEEPKPPTGQDASQAVVQDANQANPSPKAKSSPKPRKRRRKDETFLGSGAMWDRYKYLFDTDHPHPVVVFQGKENVFFYDPPSMFEEPLEKRELWQQQRIDNIQVEAMNKRITRVTRGASKRAFVKCFRTCHAALPPKAYNTAFSILKPLSCGKCPFIGKDTEDFAAHTVEHGQSVATVPVIQTPY